MTRIFISYKSEDRPFALQIADQVAAWGGDVWIDVREIRAGERWSDAIDRGLRACGLMLLIVTPESMASSNVNDEWQTYHDDKKPIIPILLRAPREPLHFQLRRLQYVDFERAPFAEAAAKLQQELMHKGIALNGRRSAPLPPPPPPVVTRPALAALMPAPFEMVRIPAGKVTLSTGQTSDLAEFQIARYPVTNAQYKQFVEAKGYSTEKWWTPDGWQARVQANWTQPRLWGDPAQEPFNRPDHPVVGVSWFEAVAFCLWLSEVTGSTIMLPTEQQWQRAAQGDTGWAFPWGKDWDGTRCQNSVSPMDSQHTAPVTQYAGSPKRAGKGDRPFGVSYMAGNVWEWCLTDYETGKQNVNERAKSRMLRGGSWFYYDADAFRVDYRSGITPEDRSYDWGFRFSSL